MPIYVYTHTHLRADTGRQTYIPTDRKKDKAKYSLCHFAR